MKKTMILAAAALVAGSALAAEVLSVNAVGFIKTTCPAGEYTALSYPFYGNEAGGGTKWVDTPIAQEATVGSKVYFWADGIWAIGTYQKQKSGDPKWVGVAADYVLKPGEGFLYQPAPTGDAQEAVVSGEVPDDATIPLTIAGSGNYTAMGLPYPVGTTVASDGTTNKVSWVDTEIAKAAPVGSKVYFWSEEGIWSIGTYQKQKTGDPKWTGVAADYALRPGEGFLYQLPATASDAEVSVVRPYDWPAEPIEIVNP